MTPGWLQEWPCICNRGERIFHAHYVEGLHSCARGCGCKEYRPDIPEQEAIRILLGPVMTNEEATTILLGKRLLREGPQENEAQRWQSAHADLSVILTRSEVTFEQ
jgi:hypothetical protein